MWSEDTLNARGCSGLPGPCAGRCLGQGRCLCREEKKKYYQLALAKQFLKIFLLYVGNRYKSHFMLYFIS